MRNWAFFFATLTACFISCGQDNGRLTCLVAGYDSLIYYRGSSTRMMDIKRGRVSDKRFVSIMFTEIQVGGLWMTIKPGGGGEVMGDLEKVVRLANHYQVNRRSLDTIDANEEKAFGFSTPPPIKELMAGRFEPLKLDLPKDVNDSVGMVPDSVKGFQMVVLLSGSSDVYAYMGGDLRKGKKYSYQELTDTLKLKRGDKKFFVVIKPSESSTYKNTVNMLDEMKITDVKHYALVDITKEEQEYLREVYRE